MEFLQTNWIWLLLIVGVVLLIARGGHGCGMGHHGPRDRARDAARPGPPGSLERGDAERREREPAGSRDPRGC